MPSLTEALGGLATSIFVPAAVIRSQAQTQADLQARSDRLNANVPQTLANASQSGILTDGQAKQSLQDMDRAVFLINDSNRKLGESVVTTVLDSAAQAPATAIKYAGDKILKPAAGVVGDTVKAIVPWQIWLILGLAIVVGVGVFAFAKGKT